MTSFIESRHNPRFKQWTRYLRRPQEEDCPWIAVEGWKHLLEACAWSPPQLLLYSDSDDRRLGPLLDRSREAVRLTPALIKRLSEVKTPQGVMAFFDKPRWSSGDLGEFVLVADGLQDPGNLGTLLRSAAAVGASMASTPGTVSRFNPKAVRASAALIFSVPFLQDTSPSFLEERGYRLWTASAQGRKPLFQTAFRGPTAVLLGSEGGGPGSESRQKAAGSLRIPMRPHAESLNASVAGSLILYEWFRQRSQPDEEAAHE